jgi:hypothetical protein
MFRSVVGDRNVLSRKRHAPRDRIAASQPQPTKHTRPRRPLCMVTEGAEKNPTQAHVSAPRGPEGTIVRNEPRLRLPHATVNQNPNVRL